MTIRTEYIDVNIVKRLRKDLQDNEEICESCGGLGLQIYNNEYGLRSEGERIDFKNLFPYKVQDLGPCFHCYNGVRKRCEYCEELIHKNYTKCPKKECKEKHGESEWQIEQKLIDNAIKLKIDDEIAKSMGMYYSDHYPYNDGYFSDIEGFLEYWDGEYDSNEQKPKYVWGTYSVGLTLDADRILKDACDDLHEEALSSIPKKEIDELQQYLNKWCKKQNGATTYYRDYKYVIEIPWAE